MPRLKDTSGSAWKMTDPRAQSGGQTRRRIAPILRIGVGRGMDADRSEGESRCGRRVGGGLSDQEDEGKTTLVVVGFGVGEPWLRTRAIQTKPMMATSRMATAIQVAVSGPMRGRPSPLEAGMASRWWTTLASLASSLPGCSTGLAGGSTLAGACVEGRSPAPNGGATFRLVRSLPLAGLIDGTSARDESRGSVAVSAVSGRGFSKERCERQAWQYVSDGRTS